MEEFFRKHSVKIAWALLVSVFVVPIMVAIPSRIQNEQIYDDGCALLEQGRYEEAIERFNDIGPDYLGYFDIRELLTESSVCPHCGAELEVTDD